MDIRRLSTILLVVLGIVWGAACAAKKPPPPIEPTTEEPADSGVEDDTGPPPKKSLFERLGKREAIAKVVDAFVKNIQADPTLKGAFKKTTGAKLEAFKNNMVDLICKESGGDCTYNGKDMKTAHQGMKITEKQWNATVEDLKLALIENKVGEDEQKELIGMLAPMKGDIVTPGKGPGPKKK